jgi:hypothetical protein
MPTKEKRFVVSVHGKVVGTYSVSELRNLISSGRVLRESECAEVSAEDWPGEGEIGRRVPVGSCPEFADLGAYLVEEDPVVLAQARVVIVNRLVLYFGTWVVVLVGMGLLLRLEVTSPVQLAQLPLLALSFPMGLALLMGDLANYLFWVPWAFYVVHAIVTFWCRKPGFAVMYVILLLALALNIIGCLAALGVHPS